MKNNKLVFDSNNIIFQKILFSIIIVLIYIIGKSIPIFGIDTSVDTFEDFNIQMLLFNSISGDRYQISVFTLGVFPYMISSLVIQIIMSSMNSDRKSRISQKKVNNISLILMLAITCIQSFFKLEELQFAFDGTQVVIVKTVAFFEMIAGAFVILWLSDRNSKYGIGGQTLIIFINILDVLIMSIQENGLKNSIVPLLISCLIMLVVIIMENAEKRIPVQRIGIYSIYNEQNYIAIKVNPVGIMPVMFTSAVYMLVQFVVTALYKIFPENVFFTKVFENIGLSSIFGVIVYIVILYLLTISMAFVFISPKEITDQLLKNGDSIIGLHAGDDTRRFLSKQLLLFSLLSSSIMSLCILIPMVLNMFGLISSSASAIPTSVMMMTGMMYNLLQEITAIKSYDLYKPFI